MLDLHTLSGLVRLSWSRRGNLQKAAERSEDLPVVT